MSVPSNPSRSGRQSKSSGQVRIIAGQWRGRRLPVANAPGLRPTGDRVRETLFNWLQSDIAGSHCLDLFAGTGALGLEALSRYAASVTFVEPDLQANRMLVDALKLFGIDETARLEQGCDTRVVQTSAELFLAENQTQFDIVFIDPPFDQALQMATLASLWPDHLSKSAVIYVEAPTKQAWVDPAPPGYTSRKEKRFGEVCARLLDVCSV
ncbi:MAG: 16S rRNA (guanine(966)-N(2))-methyltransferase RsmD [Granulosicoccus sp.]